MVVAGIVPSVWTSGRRLAGMAQQSLPTTYREMKNKQPLVIAKRELYGKDESNVISVVLYAPRPDPQGDWECSFEISGLVHPISDSTYGIDGMQALIQALEGIRITLESAPEPLSWAGERGDAGFPRFVPTFFGPEFSQHLGRVLDEEITRYAEKLENRGISGESPIHPDAKR